jgi:hypothetical protein
LNAVRCLGDLKVIDDRPPAPFVYEGLDPVLEPKSTVAEVSEAVEGTVNRISGLDRGGSKAGDAAEYL